MTRAAFIATTGDSVARARPEGDGYVIDRQLAGVDVRCLAVNPLTAAVVYAGTQGEGVLRSDDGGSSWATVGLEETIVKTLTVSPHDPGTVYAGTKPPALFASRDGGLTWDELDGFRDIPWRWLWLSPAEPPFYRAYVQAIAVSPTDPDVLLAGIEFGAIVRSADGGETWSRHCRGALRDCHSLAFHATNGDFVYQAGGAVRGRGAAVSRDGGETWRRPSEGLDRGYGWACAADPGNPDVWYVSAAPGPFKAHGGGSAEAYVFRSMDGRPWEKLAGGLPQPLDDMPYALLTDPAEPDHLYAGLANGHVWHTIDRGETWTRLPLDLGAIERSLVMLVEP